MKKMDVTIIFLICAVAFNTSHAFADTESEINHLLNYVETSPCTFIRNGSTHNGPDARDHIVKKYNYFKDRISTAEQFIEYAATKSTMSGKKYKVRCDDNEYMTAQWLIDELHKFRNKIKANN